VETNHQTITLKHAKHTKTRNLPLDYHLAEHKLRQTIFRCRPPSSPISPLGAIPIASKQTGFTPQNKSLMHQPSNAYFQNTKTRIHVA